MTRLNQACAAAALLLAAGCNVSVNNESMENRADGLERGIDNVAAAAGNAVDRVADAAENQAEALGNADLDVNLRTDGNEAAEANRH